MSKRTVLLLFLVLTASGLVQIMLACGSVSKPSVPEFTVKLVSHPYDVTPHNLVDPYTGTVTTYPSYVVENKSMDNNQKPAL